MRKLLITCTILAALFTGQVVYAQDNPPEFGKIDTTDLLMTDCSFDKGADAMNLINYENATFEVTQGGLFVDVERWARIKIFRQSGLEYANIVIPFISADKINKVTGLIAYAYNIDENGNITTEKLEKKDLFTEKSKTGTGSVRFTLPNVKPGTVIEYKYILKDDNWPELDPWLFQDLIPTRLSVCKLKYDSYVDVHMLVHATFPFESKPDSVRALDGHYKKIEQSFTMADVPAFRSEPMMSSLEDNLQRIVFAILPGTGNKPSHGVRPAEETWKIYNQRLLASRGFGLQFGADIPGTKSKLDSIKSLSTDAEKIHAVYEWVRNTVRWNNYMAVEADDLTTVWKNKEGNSAEINLLILILLRRAGIHSFPLLVSTKQHGKTDMGFASLSQFNGVDILALDGNAYYIIDGTQKFQSYKIPPYNVLNSNAFLVDEVASRWVYIEDNRELMKNVMNIQAGIDSSGVLSGKVHVFYYDYAKVNVLSAKIDDVKEDSRDLLDEGFSLKTDSLKDENAGDPEKPLVRSFNFKMEMQQTGDFYFLDPYFLSPFRRNPFIEPARHTDVDFGSNQYYAINLNITLPENIIASDLPASKEIRLADSSFSFGRIVARQGDDIVVRLHLEVLKPLYAADEYPFLKTLFDKMYLLLNDRIVFKKKE